MPEVANALPHVLTLTDIIGHGGAEEIAEELAARADPSRFRRSLCVTRSVAKVPGDSPELSERRLREAGVTVLDLNRRSRFDLRAMGRLVRFLRSQQVDLIHAHKFGSNVWAALLGRALGVPVVIAHEHTWSFEGHAPRRLLDRHVVGRLSDAVVAVSEADRRRMIDLVRMPVERVILIPNGIPMAEPGDPGAVRSELGIGSGAPVLVQTAVLRRQKAIDVMLSAMAILHESHPDARLLVVGPGNPGLLQATARRLRIADVVSFMGSRDDVADILAGANVGVLSSDFEGSPLAVLEYMAAGLPVVATDVGGLPQMVQDGSTGLLAPPRDPVTLARHVRRLLDDPRLAQEMGRRGQLRQQQEFSAEAMARRVSELYDRLLTEKGIRPADSADQQRLPAVEGV